MPDLIPAIAAAAGEHFVEAVSAQDMDEVAILAPGLTAAVEALRREGFNMLADIGCTDHHPLTPRFELSYHFFRFDLHAAAPAPPDRLRLRVFPRDDDPRVQTLSHVWPAANWAERETYDLFGIVFDGHPHLRRILMPDDWKGYPLRKDYPLRGYDRSFNPGGRIGPVPPLLKP